MMVVAVDKIFCQNIEVHHFNINGLLAQIKELEQFLNMEKIDVAMIAVTSKLKII